MADAKVSAGTPISNMALTDKLYVDRGGIDSYADFDDFTETGTFTPTIYGTTTAGTNTYDQNIGDYCRVGKLVQFSAYIDMATLDGTLSGNIGMSGLPYNHIAGNFTAISISFTSNITLTSGYYIHGYIDANSDNVLLFESNGTTGSALTQADIAANTTIMIAGSYQAL